MRINVVHAVPVTSAAFGLAEDGFTAAMEIVAQRHEVRWLNIHPYNAGHREQERLIADADFVLVRSDWLWLPTQAADRALYGNPVPVGLLIAGSTMPPPLVQMKRFDVLFYETPWYSKFVIQHPFAVHAFGVDSRFMRDQQRPERTYDWVMVGRLAPFKRPERLLDKTGRRLAVGDLGNRRPDIENRLSADGVEVSDQRSHAELADLYNDSRAVLVPCELQGGGERAVLEGRACGCAIEIADDNPKLASLIDCPIWSHEEYAAILCDSIEAVVRGRRISDDEKLAGQRARRIAVLSDKLRRAPQTAWIRGRDAIRSRATFRSGRAQ